MQISVDLNGDWSRPFSQEMDTNEPNPCSARGVHVLVYWLTSCTHHPRYLTCLQIFCYRSLARFLASAMCSDPC